MVDLDYSNLAYWITELIQEQMIQTFNVIFCFFVLFWRDMSADAHNEVQNHYKKSNCKFHPWFMISESLSLH